MVNVFAINEFINTYQGKYQQVNIIEADEEVLTKAITLVSGNATIVDVPSAELAETLQDASENSLMYKVS